MLGAIRIWELDLESAGAFTLPAFHGPLLRQVTGKALYERLGDVDAEAIFRAPDGSRPFRFDTPVQGERELRRYSRWSVRFVTFEPEVAGVLMEALVDGLAAGLGEQRVPQQLVGCRMLAHGGADAPEWDGPPDVRERADELAMWPELTVHLASPTEIKRRPMLPDGSLDRRSEMVRTPTGLDLLRATHLRAASLGYGPLARFDAEAVDDEPGSFKVYTHRRASMAQDRRYTMVGVVGSLVLRPTLLQCGWLALAEVLGLGSDTAQGKGVVRGGGAGDMLG